MILVPAIDILGGKVVRLAKGDYNRVTVYEDDPVVQAQHFEREGAELIHVVDLDGARTGHPANIEQVASIIDATDLRVEVGGGIRDMDTLGRYIDIGVERAVLGSSLITDRTFCLEAIAAYGDALVAGIDARDGKVAIEGWCEGTDALAADLVAELKEMGLRHLVYTDIARDGMQTGIDAGAYGRLALAAGFPIVASGGIASLEDLKALAALEGPGIEGAIAGRAIYEGAFSVAEGVACCKEATC